MIRARLTADIQASSLVRKCRYPTCSPQHRNSIRSFSSTRPRSFDAVGLARSALDLSQASFEAVHTWSAHPWWASILLTGAVIRLSWAPFQYLIARDAAKNQHKQPLFIAWQEAYRRQALAQFPPTEEGARSAETWVALRLKNKNQELDLKYGKRKTYRNLALTIAFLPIWITNTIAVRRMCGINILSDSSDSCYIPSLEDGGLLWFSDLTLSDPVYVMPIAFGVLQTLYYYQTSGKQYKALRETKEATLKTGTVQQKRALVQGLGLFGLHRFLAVGSSLLVFLADFPAGVVLYMIGSVSAQAGLKNVLDRFVTVKTIAPSRPRPAIGVSEKEETPLYFARKKNARK